jgi:NAD+ kinase
MKKIGLFFRPEVNAEGICRHLENSFKGRIEIFPIEQNDAVSDLKVKKLDYLFVFGGDGTILKSMPIAIKYQAAVLGFNMGNLGFMTDCKINELIESTEQVLNHKFQYENRMLLEVSLYRRNQKIKQFLALNDCVIYKGELSKLITLKLFSNNRYVYETRCDGIITATPTGSTAYSLSSGGPIIVPEMDALIVTPMNPHILSIRPIIFSDKDTIHYRIEEPHSSTVMQLDGDNVMTLMPKDKIVIKSSQKKMKFVKLSHRTYYQILRKKLHMGKH